LRIAFYENVASLPPDLCRKVDTFLSEYKEITGQPSVLAYGAATKWGVAFDGHERVVGFAAQRIFRLPEATVIQIMGTYVATSLRGRNVANTLLQSGIFVDTWLRAPWKPIIWCTRTRVPAVYATARRFYRLHPRLGEPAENRTEWASAERLARMVYGDHVSLDPSTFVMHGSYKAGSTFRKPRHRTWTPVHEAFAAALDYDKNETLFIVCRLNRLHVLRAIVASLVFGLTNRISSWFEGTRARRSHEGVSGDAARLGGD
jgi:hypothetical protein